MNSIKIVFTLLTVLLLPSIAYCQLSPFDDIKFVDDNIQVQISNKWYVLNSINQIDSKYLIAKSQEIYNDRWAQRIAEDLPELFEKLGKPFNNPVKLKVSLLTSGEVKILDIEATSEKRNEIRNRYRNEREYPELPPPLLTLTKSLALENLNQFEQSLNGFSYAKWRGFDYKTATNKIRTQLSDSVPRRWLALEIAKVIYRFGDGHGRLRSLSKFMGGRVLPIRFESVAKDIAAINPNGGLYVPGYPWLVSIDGVPASKWLEVIGQYVADGSPQMKKRRSIELLNRIDFLREQKGLKISPTALLVLRSNNDKKVRLRARLIDKAPGKAIREFEAKVLNNNLGYLRIPEMDGDKVDWLHGAMKMLRNTKGLIIDVRGNGGGTRKLLRALFPYTMKQGEKPHIANVAAYHLRAPEARDKMPGRFLFPASEFKKETREVISSFNSQFKPEWPLPVGEFSEWHYMIMEPGLSDSQYRYEESIVLLIDEDCFSATDIFAAAFKGRSNVTLVGRPTSGGSGSSTKYELSYSRIPYRLSTMASFQPSGKLYDGNGVLPDSFVKPSLDDVLGLTDSALDRAKLILLKGI